MGFGLAGFSQEAEKVEKKTERIKVVKGGEPAPTALKKEEKELTPEEELASCKAQLEALNKKEAFLRSNPPNKEEAEKNGWFKDAAKTRATLEKRIKELNLELKK